MSVVEVNYCKIMKYGITTRLKSFLNPLSIMEGEGLTSFDFFKNFLSGYKNQSPIKEGFNSNSYVYAITNLIATLASDIKIDVVKISNNGDEEIIKEGEVYDFHLNPNHKESYKEYAYKAVLFQLLLGNTFEHPIESIGFSGVKETYLLYQSNLDIQVDYNITGAYPTSYQYTIGGKTYNLTPDDVIQTKTLTSDVNSAYPTLGISPLQAAYKTLSASNDILEADASLIKNRGAIGMLTDRSLDGITMEEAESVNDSLKKRIGGAGNFGSIKTTNANLDFLKFSMSPADLKILESGVMKLRDLCSVYGVSSNLFNDPQSSTYNNIKEDNKRLYTNGVIPVLERFIDSRNKNFISQFNDDRFSYKLVINTSDIESLQEDKLKLISNAKTRSEIVRNVLAGIPENWSKESAKAQLIDALGIEDEEAKTLIG